MKNAAILFAILTISVPCAAATITVNWDGTGDYTTIQAGINAAVSGADTVIVHSGTYYENINFNGKNIVLTSLDPTDPSTVAATIIDGGNSGSVVIFSGTESSTCELTGFTITNGKGSGQFRSGGGILGNGTLAAVSKCTIKNSTSSFNNHSYGGGLYDCDGSITDCTITGNTASALGGGLAFCDGSITNCTITGNSAEDYGGGLYRCNGSITNCIITGNTAYEGGGLYNCNGAITNCRVTGNSASSYGGGVYDCDGQITNSVITGNSAGNGGGGLTVCDGRITNCTITGNSVTYSLGKGSGLYDCNGPITNCIIWGNTCNIVDQLFYSSVPTYSCIQNWTGGGVGNIIDDPLLIDPASGNYYLKAWSRCIDAGTNDPAGGLSPTDMDGNPRPIDGNNDGAAIADMGVYEMFPSVNPVIWISDLSYSFSAEEGAGNPNDQTLTIHNAGGGTLNWTITETCDWLSVNPASGSSTGEGDDVTISVDTSGMTWGQYSCELTILDPLAENNPQVVTVNLDIDGSMIGLSASTFNFRAEEGGSDPNDQTLTITNVGVGTLDWTVVEGYFDPQDPNIFIEDDCGWLSVSPASGSSTGESDEVTISVDVTGMANGGYNCQLIVSDPFAENSPQVVTVGLGIGGELFVPDQYPTIQAGIDAAMSGDTIIVADGVYTGVGNRNIQIKKEDITVRSENGPGVTIIDCEDMTRGFYIDANSVELEGFTITNGNTSGYGGGIYIRNGRPVINNCTISGNLAYRGGGIYSSWWGDSPIISNCTISGNSAYRGGGLYGCGGAITNCIIWENTATNSGDQLYNSSVPTYSCIQDWGGGGTGNISDDPLFADAAAGDYHLKSEAGRWVLDYNYMDPNGTPADPNDDFWVTVPGDTWVTDGVTSPCIDAGEPIGYWDPNSTPTDPNDDFWVWGDNSDEELWPDGGRINMGAYGGTAEASMSGNPVGSAADFNKDDSVDGLDLQMLADKWLLGEILLAEDINRNNFVDMVDVALFAQEWLWEQ